MRAGSRLALVCLVWSLCALLSEAYLFSLLLSNPVVKTDSAARSAGGVIDLAPEPLARRGAGGSESDLRSGDSAQSGGEGQRAPSGGQPLRTRAVGRSEADLGVGLDLDLDLNLDLELALESYRTADRSETNELDSVSPAARGHISASVVQQLSVEAGKSATEVDISARLDSMASQQGCLSDRQCGRGRFCDADTGACQRRRRAGQSCARDGECRGRGAICDLGHCQRRHQHKEKKELVSECRSDADCGADSCCARLSSGTVCRPRTPVGQRCQALPANLPVPIYPTCPCQRGSECKYVHRPGEDWTLWKAYDNLRCVRD